MIQAITINTKKKKNYRKKIIMSGSIGAFIIVTAVVCFVVEPVKNKVTEGWGQIVNKIRSK